MILSGRVRFWTGSASLAECDVRDAEPGAYVYGPRLVPHTFQAITPTARSSSSTTPAPLRVTSTRSAPPTRAATRSTSTFWGSTEWCFSTPRLPRRGGGCTGARRGLDLRTWSGRTDVVWMYGPGLDVRPWSRRTDVFPTYGRVPDVRTWSGLRRPHQNAPALPATPAGHIRSMRPRHVEGGPPGVFPRGMRTGFPAAELRLHDVLVILRRLLSQPVAVDVEGEEMPAAHGAGNMCKRAVQASVMSPDRDPTGQVAPMRPSPYRLKRAPSGRRTDCSTARSCAGSSRSPFSSAVRKR